MCSLYISYNRYHGVFRKVIYVAVLVETRACWPRDACYPGCARHLTPLYVPVSPWARSATCKPRPMVLVPDSTVHCSRPPARNLHLSSNDHALGPWVGFMYIYNHAMLLTWVICLKKVFIVILKPRLVEHTRTHAHTHKLQICFLGCSN